VGEVVGVSAVREASVVGVSEGKGTGVFVGGIGGGVGVGEEQEIRRRIQMAERRMRDVRCWGMQAILTEIVLFPARRVYIKREINFRYFQFGHGRLCICHLQPGFWELSDIIGVCELCA
jgi:hypothetical protein